ncbi:MAG: DEAD/DEAH box helicase family protein [bacterium]
MKLQFDPNQPHQLEAVAAVGDLFDGQPLEKPEFSVIYQTGDAGLFSGQSRTELGVGNRLLLAEEKLLANARGIQTRHDIDGSTGLLTADALEAWELFDAAMNAPRRCPHFSVEMETGTGKTYVYLRTIFELSRRYGFQKFIIVVPSVAIREGVLKNIDITREHFRALYNNLAFEHFVYDAKKVNKLRQFAVSNTLQILVINIDAFRKNFSGTEEEQKSNVIYKESDRLSGRQPIEFVQAALREGWDNPNVFQICTLNETRSALKKRQEIGRGLRLPVDQSGRRVFDESVNKLYVMANESYEDFARTLQTEYEEDCGVTFGKVPITALARLARVVDGEERAIGREAAEKIREVLERQGILDAEGRIQPAFDPKRKDFKIELPEAHRDLQPAVIDLLASYQIERHIRKDRDERPNRLRKEVLLSAEFETLWNKIKPKITYRVEFETEKLVQRAVDALRQMERIEIPKIRVSAGQVGVTKGGVTTAAISEADERAFYGSRPLPDLLAYLQNETELTRSTIVRILKESGRLSEIFHNPQRFMDAVAAILRHELHRLLVDGIKYERIIGAGPEAEWEMMLFKNEEIIDYLNSLQVNKSVYEHVVYESEIERAFARRLDEREDIRLFVKLPNWFEVETPVGKYNPDWAIVKHASETLYLVRETKSTHDFLTDSRLSWI